MHTRRLWAHTSRAEARTLLRRRNQNSFYVCNLLCVIVIPKNYNYIIIVFWINYTSSFYFLCNWYKYPVNKAPKIFNIQINFHYITLVWTISDRPTKKKSKKPILTYYFMSNIFDLTTLIKLINCYVTRDWMLIQEKIKDHKDFDRWFVEYPEVSAFCLVSFWICFI